MVAYLRSGAQLHYCMGFSHCRFRGGPPDEEMGCADLTDGVWLWPEGLHIYVERYGVRLPEDFCRHAATSGPVSLDAQQLRSLQKASFDFNGWINWCQAKRSNRLLAAITPPTLCVAKWLARRMIAREAPPPTYEVE
jgi:hypothetical protein